MGNENLPDEQRQEKESWWSHKERGTRLLIGILIALCLSAFLHFREVRVEILEPGTLARHYVVAQVDFDFPDDEATNMLRQESFRDLGAVFAIDSDEITSRAKDFKEYLVNHNEWRRDESLFTFDEVSDTISAVKDEMLSSRFTDPRTFQKLREMKISTENMHVFVPPSSDERVHLPLVYWDSIRSRLLKGKQLQGSTVKFVLSNFSRFGWNFHKDIEMQMEINDRIEEIVPQKYTRVRAGSRIIDQGEKINSRHIAMMNGMKAKIAESRDIWMPETILGALLFGFMITLVGGYFFYYCRPQLIASARKLALYAVVVIFTLLLAKLYELLVVRNPDQIIEMVRYPILVPFAAILLTTLLDDEVALYTTCFLAVILAVSLAVEINKFLIMNLVTGIVAILTSRNLRKRKQVFVVCGKVWIVAIPIIFAYAMMAKTVFNLVTIADLISTLCFMAVIALLVVGFLPLLESIFRIMTDITLMEYMDPNNELLRRLSIEAPGTYQHSLVVGSLAEAAAQAIGANGLFCRVSTMYHDIGKLFNPHYFTENQLGGFNIHQLLTPLESTQVIIAHVSEGETLARKFGLPQSFINIIREHHGTTLVYYFYCKQIEQMEGDKSGIDDNQFRYPGPKPKTKESAIIMIADTIEAASRAMEDATESSITELVNRLVSEKASEGQFDDCHLTFEELGRVKAAIIKTLSVTRHIRVKYPAKPKSPESA